MKDGWDQYDDEYEDDNEENEDDNYDDENELGLGVEDNDDYFWESRRESRRLYLGEPSIDGQESQDDIFKARNHYEAMVRPSIIHNLIIIYNMRYISSTSYSDRIL